MSCILGYSQQKTNDFPISKKMISDSKKDSIVYNRLYQYGIADAFVGGLYKGTLSLKDLKSKGNFGLGAPDMLDGELTIMDGKVYQTKATGLTVEPEDGFKTALSFVTFFSPEATLFIEKKADRLSVLQQISKKLLNKNSIYAVKVTGKFNLVKTRAFPPVENEPFPALTSIFHKQKTFEFTHTEGVMIGYYIPEYLNGINVKDFHFHFLSTDRKQGGHILDFIGENLKIELAELDGFELEIPKDKDFQNFQFNTKDNEALKRVEQGK
ncbi:acetolactate decarboxylase [Chryseobacterium sediminis]|uniref:Alpha-acetolactate decarboxylase n=1 Tax=Chryseobacterium sediminis TaxID=1679494 RepID=A0ABR6PZR4_9FLAO|nr:acetolactate decarboxylase [Chryseobacterium sediminis]MBB6330378.1 acetolactate decarboxylase [Chryseobacterium sediminis]